MNLIPFQEVDLKVSPEGEGFNPIIQTIKIANTSVETSIEDLFVYLKKSDRILTTSVNGDSASMHKYFYPNDELALEKWNEILQGYYPKNYITMPYILQTGSVRKGIVYTRSLPFIRQDEVIANIFIVLDESKFLKYVEEIKKHIEESLVIIDRSNAVVASGNFSELPDELHYDKLIGKSGAEYFEIEGKKMVGTYCSSEVANWKYIYLSPYRVLWEKAHNLRMMTIAGTGLCILIGGVLAYYLAKKNYKPMRNLIKFLEQFNRNRINSEKDEYSFIHQVVSRMSDEQNEVMSKLERQKQALRSNYLIRLLKGRGLNDMPADDSLSAYNIQFISEHFAVMLFYINETEDLYQLLKKIDAIEHFKIIQFIIKNVTEELMNENHTGFVVEIDDIMGCLLNFSQDKTEQAKDEIRRIAEDTQYFIKTIV